MSFLKFYGETEGPLGFPMRDVEAKALEDILKQHPDHEYGRLVSVKATSEISEGERADVSWIQTEAIDMQREIVLTSGFDDSIYRGNPIVTYNHDYSRLPIGKSTWRRKVKEGDRRGIKAKTMYPARPATWADPIWPPDAAFDLVRAGLMAGKSIGFVRLNSHSPTEAEIKAHPEWANALRVIDKWALLEYSLTWLPVNPECLVEAVSKGIVSADALERLSIPLLSSRPLPSSPPRIIAHTCFEDLERSVKSVINGTFSPDYIMKAIEESYQRLRGWV